MLGPKAKLCFANHISETLVFHKCQISAGEILNGHKFTEYNVSWESNMYWDVQKKKEEKRTLKLNFNRIVLILLQPLGLA